jgi:hypothetical protein
MGGKAVPQRMDGDRLAELGCRPRRAASGLQHARIERPAVILAGKQPMRRPCFPPIGAQHVEELRRQHDIAVAATLALIDPDQHAAAVDVGEFETHHLRDPQPGGIGGHQRDAMLQVRHRREESYHLVGAEDHRQLPALACVRDALDDSGATERDAVKEAQGANRDVETGPRNAGRREVNLISANFRQPEPIGRPIEMPGEFGDCVHVAALRHRRQIAHLHVLDHAATQRGYLGHLAASLRVGASTAPILSAGPADRLND